MESERAELEKQKQGFIAGAVENGIAKDVAAVGYLLNAKSVTGQLICVDGGQHLAWQTPDVLGVE